MLEQGGLGNAEAAPELVLTQKKGFICFWVFKCIYTFFSVTLQLTRLR